MVIIRKAMAGWNALVAICALGLGACAVVPQQEPAGPPPAILFTPVSFANLTGWAGDDHGAALSAFRASCGQITRRASADTHLGSRQAAGRMADWLRACAAAGNAAGDARAFFETWFVPHAVTVGDAADGLFTGYFEPELRGSRSRGGPYQSPLYAPPPEMGHPYLTRAEIDAGALAGRGLELVWVDDPVDAFFMHIQGSGRVRLDNGAVIRLGFADHNGHTYVAIGRELVRRGEMPLDAVSMQSIRAWLTDHPDRAAELMQTNPRYIFFQEIADAGPVGAQGIVLTPGRSIAVDRDVVPLGVPIWVETADALNRARAWRRLMVAQDTGSAIKGAVRGDIFFGSGAAAGERAGRMNAPGRWFLLLPKTGTRPTALREAAPDA